MQLQIIEIELITKHSASFLHIPVFSGQGVIKVKLVVVFIVGVVVVVVVPVKTSHKMPKMIKI